MIAVNSTMLTLDRRNSSLTPDSISSGAPAVKNWFPQNRTRLYAPIDSLTRTSIEGERHSLQDTRLALRGYVDGSVIELFVNERIALTGLVFPTLADAIHVKVSNKAIVGVDVWLLEDTLPVLD